MSASADFAKGWSSVGVTLQLQIFLLSGSILIEKQAK